MDTEETINTLREENKRLKEQLRKLLLSREQAAMDTLERYDVVIDSVEKNTITVKEVYMSKDGSIEMIFKGSGSLSDMLMTMDPVEYLDVIYKPIYK